MSTWLIGMILAASALAGAPTDTRAALQRKVIIYASDLFHPHDDPDDHFDLATLFALPDVDVRAIMLDIGDRQKQKPGRIPLQQMFQLTGRRGPFATGLSQPLKSTRDTAADQPAEDQGAVELLLRTLRESKEQVMMVTTGSLRDLCAAFNREPDLLGHKLQRVYINIGNAADGTEWNVDLDVHAYVGLMRSGLPIYWCPCMPRGNPGSTFWTFGHQEVLDGAPRPLLNFFIYALQTVSPQELDPQAALAADLRPWRHLVMKMSREMWSTASILDAADMRIYRVGDGYRPARSAPDSGRIAEVFTFAPARVETDDRGRTRAALNVTNPNMYAFRVIDAQAYGKAMKDSLRWLMVHFPLATQYQEIIR